MEILALNEITDEIREGNDLEKLSLSLETKLREDLEFDSYDLAQLTVLIESKTGVDVFKGEYPETVADILGKLS